MRLRLAIKGSSEGGRWVYNSRTGAPRMAVLRFDLPDGSKECRPLKPLADGRWQLGDPAGPLPLYGDDRIPDDGPLFIVEGEKSADAMHSIGLPAVTSSHGAKAASRTDWTPIANRDVAILPDADEPGDGYANEVATIARSLGCKVRIVNDLPGPDGTPDNRPAGWDVADWIETRDSDDPETLAAFIADLADAAPEAQPIDDGLTPIPLGDLWTKHPDLREPVLTGLLRRGQVGNLISTSKSYKTYLILGLAISFVKRAIWLEQFPTDGGRVLVIDMELQEPDLTKRTKEIADAMYADPVQVQQNVDILCLRGKNVTINEIEGKLLAIPPRKYSLIILDPLYKLYPDNFDENSNAQMTNLYRRFERIAENADAAMMIVHHASKGNQADKRVTDVGSGAGAQARAPDAHIALREHEEDGCIVFDAKVRSFAPPQAVVMRWQYPLWRRERDLNPLALKTGKKARNPDTAQPTTEESAVPDEPWTRERFVDTFLTDAAQDKESILFDATTAGKMSHRLAKQLFESARAKGLIHEWRYVGDGRRKDYAKVAQPVAATAGGQA